MFLMQHICLDDMSSCMCTKPEVVKFNIVITIARESKAALPNEKCLLTRMVKHFLKSKIKNLMRGTQKSHTCSLKCHLCFNSFLNWSQ